MTSPNRCNYPRPAGHSLPLVFYSGIRKRPTQGPFLTEGGRAVGRYGSRAVTYRPSALPSFRLSVFSPPGGGSLSARAVRICAIRPSCGALSFRTDATTRNCALPTFHCSSTATAGSQKTGKVPCAAWHSAAVPTGESPTESRCCAEAWLGVRRWIGAGPESASGTWTYVPASPGVRSSWSAGVPETLLFCWTAVRHDVGARAATAPAPCRSESLARTAAGLRDTGARARPHLHSISSVWRALRCRLSFASAGVPYGVPLGSASSRSPPDRPYVCERPRWNRWCGGPPLQRCQWTLFAAGHGKRASCAGHWPKFRTEPDGGRDRSMRRPAGS